MIRDDLAQAVRRALADATLPEPPSPIVLEPPKQRDRGDWATPVALTLQKSFGWDFGANASKVFTLVYGMTSSSQIYRRFPGVEGSAYFIGGIGVNYQRAENMILAPMRAGVGLRGGANVGYLAYSRKRRINPF